MATLAKTTQYRNNKIEPKQLALWVGCASMMMLFAAFTSAYIVRQAGGNWYEFQLPTVFYTSTVFIVASSLTLHGAFLSFKKDKEAMYKSLLVVTFLLGCAFLYFQYQGYLALTSMGLPIDGPVSGSFIYVISAVHAAHVIGGLGTLIVALVHAFGLPYKVTKRRKSRFALVLTYWHFVDFLWIYLLVFFISQQN